MNAKTIAGFSDFDADSHALLATLVPNCHGTLGARQPATLRLFWDRV
jgi:hypothetical protein